MNSNESPASKLTTRTSAIIWEQQPVHEKGTIHDRLGYNTLFILLHHKHTRALMENSVFVILPTKTTKNKKSVSAFSSTLVACRIEYKRPALICSTILPMFVHILPSQCGGKTPKQKTSKYFVNVQHQSLLRLDLNTLVFPTP